MARQDETDIGFRLEDYTDPDAQHCRIVILPDASIDYLLSVCRFGSFSPTRWTFDGVGIIPGGETDQIKRDFIYQTEAALIMACDGEQLNNTLLLMNDNLFDLKNSLEALNQKAPDLVTLEDLIDDLAGSPLGTVADLVSILDWMRDVFPILDVKFAAGDLLKLFFDWKFRRDLLKAIRAMDATNKIGNIIEGGETAAEAIETVTEAIGLGFGGAMEIVGETANVVDAITNLLEFLFGNPSQIGALKGIENAILTLGTIQAEGCAPCTIQELKIIFIGLPPGTVEDNDSEWDGSSSTPPTSGSGATGEWGDSLVDEDRCKAANFIVEWIYQFAQSVNFAEGENILSLAAKLKNWISLLPPLGVTLTTLSQLLGQMLVKAAQGDNLFSTVVEVLFDNRPEIICALYQADSLEQAVTDVENILLADGRMFAADLWAITYFLNTNNVGGLLFWDNSLVDLSEYVPADDCTGCAPTGDCFYTITEGSGDPYPGGDFVSELIGENEYIGLDYRTINDTGSETCPQQLVTVNSVSGHIDGTLIVSYLNASGAHTTDDITGLSLPRQYTTRGGPAGGAYFTLNTGLNGGSHFSANITFEDWS